VVQRVQEMLKQKAARQGGGTNSRTPSPLMGKLFDENGESHACGAKKGNRRCPYFVSRKLVRGADKTRESRWRVSGEKIEPAVMAAARQMLSDRGALASTLKAYGFAAAELKQARSRLSIANSSRLTRSGQWTPPDRLSTGLS
jgi:site-specific DNA recombinase